jgi:hypothetical protein
MRKEILIGSLFLTLTLVRTGTALFGQSVQDRPRTAAVSNAGTESAPGLPAETEIPLRRIALFSSGMGYFEHAGEVSDAAELILPINTAAINDVLKSLTINDASSPSVRYPSEQTLYRTLQSLRIDLSGNPGAAQILEGSRGEEVQVNTPAPVSGRILGVEYRAPAIPSAGGLYGEDTREPFLSLISPQGIRVIALKDISSFSFTDPAINGDLHRALDLIRASREAGTRNLAISLPGKDSRTVTLGYVIPAPVWKVSYRLDLNQEKPLLQGWAIVDNDGDTDWTDVELSLITGRQVSFVQELYAPYYLPRPTVPLAIAGIAEARSYDSGWGGSQSYADDTMAELASAPQAKALRRPAPEAPAPVYGARQNSSASAAETPRGQAAGDQFEFTFKNPVTLERQRSALFPLVEGTLEVKKTLVFNGTQAARGGQSHPAISAELTNTTGMRLPAGPITVFDGGVYAGDALIDFCSEGEKRLISYGEDLAVSAAITASTSQELSAVTISGGIMVITRKLGFEKTYVFNNASGERKRLILEHPITPGTSLVLPAEFDERTDSLYRFSMTLPVEQAFMVTVREENTLAERIGLFQLRAESFTAYASNQEIPGPIREALQRAIELKKSADAAKAARKDAEDQRAYLVSEQDRIRRNLEAAGNQTPQGQEYLKRLVSMDDEIDTLSLGVEEARKKAQAAQKEYEEYLGSISL